MGKNSGASGSPWVCTHRWHGVDDAYRSSGQRRPGLRLELNQNPLDVDDAIDAGNQLEHYQQDYLANNTVKVTFFAPEPELNAALGFAPAAPLRVATLDELFASKALVCAERSKTRDWFDLYTLMTAHGYAIQDVHGFRETGHLAQVRHCLYKTA